MDLASAPDIVDLLKEEHLDLRALCSELSGWSPGGRTVHLELSDRLLRHEIAEELVVYPVLLGYRGGAADADGCRKDQASELESVVAPNCCCGAISRFEPALICSVSIVMCIVSGIA